MRIFLNRSLVLFRKNLISKKVSHFMEALAVLVGCWCLQLGALMFTRRSNCLKYFLMFVLSIIGCIVFYSFLKMMAEGLAS